VAAPPPPTPARALPPEVERALQALEAIPAERLAEVAGEILRRLGPLLRPAPRAK
jgi:hypothetical protein